MPRTKTPRDLTKYRLLPSLDPETYAGLKANIALNGVQVPVVKDEDGYILDGFARAKIAEELGYECPSLTVKGLTEQEKRSQVRALNLARRHLDYATRREIIADELRENPDRSNRWIGKSLGVDHKAVARVRTPMGATGVLPQLSHTLGADGKYRPATRVSLPSNGDGRLAFQRDYIDPDDEEGILRAATEIRQQRNEERTRQQFEKEEAARTKLKRQTDLDADRRLQGCPLRSLDR
jgi:ParB-like chromosome segregation protein Spo0J